MAGEAFWSAPGGASVAVEDDGAEIVAAASRLNFTGAGVTVTDSGAGEVGIAIPGGGGGGSSLVVLDDVTISTAAQFVSSAIPSGHNAIQIELMARSTTATAGEQLTIQFNSDTGANYSSQILYGTNSTVGAAPAASTGTPRSGWLPGSSAPAGMPSSGRIVIPFYTSTSFHKVATSELGHFTAASTAGGGVEMAAVRWASTAAITSVTLFPGTGAGTFATGSRFRLLLLP